MAIIFHIDVNSAYLSWSAVEELEHGSDRDLRLIPSIVGGDMRTRHGVVLAKSVPAKSYGIHTGEPVANAFRKCPNLVMVGPDHALYERKSEALRAFLRTYTPDIEPISIDECFFDYTGIQNRYASPVEGATKLKDAICDRFGFTVNIGISTNKTLAKMASDFEKPNQVHTLYPEEIKEKMWPLPVSALYMAGHASVETLKKLEIRTIGDLAHADPKILELHLKSHGKKLWESANGIGDDHVNAQKAEAKDIGNSITLSEDVKTLPEAKEVLKRLADSVGARLREADKRAGMVSVEIKYNDFTTCSHQTQVPNPTQSDSVIFETAVQLFTELWNGTPIRLLGIRTSKLTGLDAPEQLSLFDGADPDMADRKKQEKLDAALDEVRRKYGPDAVVRGRLPET